MRLLYLILPLLFTTLLAEDNSEKKDAKILYEDVPIPVDLRQGWFAFYREATSDELEKRVQATQLAFDSMQKQVDENTRLQADTEIKRILFNLRLYNVLKKIEPEYTLGGLVHKKSYTFDEFIALADRVHSLKNQTQVEQIILNQQKNFIDDLKQSLYNKRAVYSNLPSSSTERYLAGLEIIAERVRLAYLQEKFDLILQNNEIEKEVYQRLNYELQVAIKNIHYDEENISLLENDLRDLRIQISHAYQDIIDLETKSIEEYVGRQFESSPYHLLDQEVVYSMINYAKLHSKAVFYESALFLIRLKKDDEVTELDQNYDRWKGFLSTTKNMVETWRQLLAIDTELFSKQWLQYNLTDGSEEGENATLELRKRYEKAVKAMVALETTSKNLYYVNSVIDLIDKEVLSTKKIHEKVGVHFLEGLGYIYDSFYNFMNFALFEINEIPVTALSILKIIVILIVAYFFSSFVQSTMDQIIKKRTKISQPTIYTLKFVIHYTILVIAVLISLFSIGLNLNNLALILGALGIGIGFGLQSIVHNFLSGLSILFERNVKIGDYVELESGHFGKVMEINVQNATVRTFDGLDILVPNSKLIERRLINWTKKDPYLRLRIPFGVAYGTNEEFVRDIVIKAAMEVPSTLHDKHGHPEPSVWLVEFGESSLNFQLVVWVNIRQSVGRTSLRALYTETVLKALKENGISIPFPQRDLHIISKSNEELTDEKKSPQAPV